MWCIGLHVFALHVCQICAGAVDLQCSSDRAAIAHVVRPLECPSVAARYDDAHGPQADFGKFQVKRYGLALKPAPTSAGEVYFPTDDLQLVLAQRDPLLTFTWQHLMMAAAQGRIGPFTPDQLFEAEMHGGGDSPTTLEQPQPTAQSVQEDLDKLAALGLVVVELLN